MSRTRTPRLAVEPLEDRAVPAVIYAVTNSQRLQTFDSSNPAELQSAASITGLSARGEKITDIDVRPSDGALFGRSTLGRLYRIDPGTGSATAAGGPVALGQNLGLGFDPVGDALRVVNFSGGTSGINTNTGLLSGFGQAGFVDGDVFSGVPSLTGIAFTGTATSSQAFGIDPVRDTLVAGVGAAGDGRFATVGSLGIDVGNAVGFDTDPATGVGFATFQPNGAGRSFLSVVNLETGRATVLGPVGPSAPLILDIAVARTITSPTTRLPVALDAAVAGFNTTTLGGVTSTNPASSGVTGNGTNTNGTNTTTSTVNGANTNGLNGNGTNTTSTVNGANGVLAGFNPNGTLFSTTGLNTTGVTNRFNGGFGSTGSLASSGFSTPPSAPLFSTNARPLGAGLVGGTINPFGTTTGFGNPTFTSGFTTPSFTPGLQAGAFGSTIVTPFGTNAFSVFNPAPSSFTS